MDRSPRIELKTDQRLLMTPLMQQSLKLLQMSALELNQFLQQELVENPTLEMNEAAEEEAPAEESPEKEVGPTPAETPATPEEWEFNPDDYRRPSSPPPSSENANPMEALATKVPTLQEHLLGELHISTSEAAVLAAGRILISLIDDQGYFRGDLRVLAEETAISYETFSRALELLQSFDPPGIAARDLRECLLLQIARRGWNGQWVEEIVRNHLDDIEANRPHRVAEALGIELQAVLDASAQITSLEPIPGKSFGTGDVRFVVPEVFIEKIDGVYVITLNEDVLPRLRLSPTYQRLLSQARKEKGEVLEYLKTKMQTASFLIKALDQRQRTLYRVAEAIVVKQKDFFEYGIKHFQPLVLREIAEEISVHEATVSRATRGKYAQTPRGTFELKFFFSSGIETESGVEVSSRAIKAMIKEIIAGEETTHPLSDQRIAEILSSRGFRPARRTVTKYREALRILPAQKRKKFG